MFPQTTRQMPLFQRRNGVGKNKVPNNLNDSALRSNYSALHLGYFPSFLSKLPI